MVGRMRYPIGVGHTEKVSQENLHSWEEKCRLRALPSCGPGVPVYRVDPDGTQVQVKAQRREAYEGSVNSAFSEGGFLGSLKVPDAPGISDPRGPTLRAKLKSVQPTLDQAWDASLKEQLAWMEDYAGRAKKSAQSTMKKMFGENYMPEEDPVEAMGLTQNKAGPSSLLKRSAEDSGECSKRPRL
jgi:hypothetical protein